MALLELWQSDRTQILSKRVDQLIAFAGEGRLKDGNSTSEEFRGLLMAVSSEVLETWIESCLEVRFTDFGFVLQDIVNEIGRRLGFDVTHGVYRSHASEGYDGLWISPDGRALVVESKSSTSYSINLNRISHYRNQASPLLKMEVEEISILIVVGDEDTSEFEAQVRGSRYAWDIRLLGAKALYRLLKLRESLDQPIVERQVRDILFPQEFTRLDRIIDLVFATAEDSQELEIDEPSSLVDTAVTGRSASGFHGEILPRLERHFGKPLVKQSRVQWASVDQSVLVSCQVSKRYDSGVSDFWFGLKKTTFDLLKQHPNAYCAFGLGSAERVLLLPLKFLEPHLQGLFTSPTEDGQILHWHIRFAESEDKTFFLGDRDRKKLDVTSYLLHD
jgi:hypothetical protein